MARKYPLSAPAPAPQPVPPTTALDTPRVRTAQGPRRGALLVLLSAASFGFMPVFAKLAYADNVGLKTLLTMRFCLAAVCMWAIWWASGRGTVESEQGDGGRARRGLRAVVPPLVAMGALGYVGQSFTYFTAASKMSATATGLLLYTYPVLVTLLAWLFYREALTPRKLVALALALLGAVLVLGLVSSMLGGGAGVGNMNGEGIAWGLSAAGIYSLYIIAGARFTRGINPIFASAVIISAAAATYLVWSLAVGELVFDFSAGGYAWAVAIALISTAVAITTFFMGMRDTGPSRAAIISTLEPAVTVIAAAIVLGERITLEQLAGGALILLSVVILQWRVQGEQRKAA